MPIYLVVVKGPPGLINRRCLMPKGVSVLGTNPEMDIPLADVAGLEPKHARLYLDVLDLTIEGFAPATVGGRSNPQPKIRVPLNGEFTVVDGLVLRYEYVPRPRPPGAPPPPQGANQPPTLYRQSPKSVQKAAAANPALAATKLASPEAQAGRPSDKAIPVPAPRPSDKAIPIPAQARPSDPAIPVPVQPSAKPSDAAIPVPAPRSSDKAIPVPAAAPKPSGQAVPVPKADAKPAAPAKPPAVAKPLAEIALETGDPVTVEDLLKVPAFQAIPRAQLERLPGSVVRRRFKKGEVICREGEFGSTAFYLISGGAEVYLQSPMAHVKSTKDNKGHGLFGLLRKFTHKLVGQKDDPRPDAGSRQFIPIDGPEDLPIQSRLGVMRPGDLFGEMSCLNFYPRSATVRATDDCEALEMIRTVLEVLRKNPKFKEMLEKNYRDRALAQHLRSVPLLHALDDEFIQQLKARVELSYFEPGAKIVEQGQKADSFYLIRVGTVRVSQALPGGELTLTYLGRGEFFGEMGLLGFGTRTANCTALDHVEAVRIGKPDFDFMLSWYDGLRESFEEIVRQRHTSTKNLLSRGPTFAVDQFFHQGLMEAQSLLLLDLERCTRCDECVHACAESHDGVTRLVREGLRFDKYLVPTSCRSCMDPVCMIGCPVGSIRRKETLEIVIEDWCIGCEKCAKQCPYGNITMHEFEGAEVPAPAAKLPAGAVIPATAKKADARGKQKAVTCDLCTDLAEPSCVYACPHDAAKRVNAREFFEHGGDADHR